MFFERTKARISKKPPHPEKKHHPQPAKGEEGGGRKRRATQTPLLFDTQVTEKEGREQETVRARSLPSVFPNASCSKGRTTVAPTFARTNESCEKLQESVEDHKFGERGDPRRTPKWIADDILKQRATSIGVKHT